MKQVDAVVFAHHIPFLPCVQGLAYGSVTLRLVSAGMERGRGLPGLQKYMRNKGEPTSPRICNMVNSLKY